jgi:hypothetical protein
MKLLQRVLFVAWLAVIVFGIAYPTLRLPYLSDDFEHGQLISEIRAGLRPASDLIAVPFHGQTLVLLNLIFWFGTMAGGMSLFWVRVAICAVHVAGAAGCAILCVRWTGSRLAGFVAGSLYAAALGFINEQIWWPSSAIFCLGAAFLILTLVAVEYDAIGWAIVMLIVAALGMNGVLVAALILPIYCWLRGRRRDAGILLGVILALLAVAFWQQTRTQDREQMTLSLRAIELGAWLIGTGPLRFVSGFTTFALPGFRTILEWSPVAWLPLLASAWLMRRRYGRVLLLAWTPAILISIMVGLARADYHPDRYGPGVLYIADRYYYFFLFPLVVHCVLFMSTLQLRRWGSVAAQVVLAAAIIGSRAHFIANVPRGNFEIAGRALDQGRALVEKIRTSPVKPLILNDAPIPIDGAHKNMMTPAFLIYSEYPRGIFGVRIVQGPLDARQPVIENSRIDFKKASYEQNLVSGFSWWEPPFRWMGERGEIRLIAAPGDLIITAYAPVDQLHRSIEVTVGVNALAIGKFAISTPGTHDYRLQMPELTPGGSVDITLTSHVVWHARDIFPDSLDERNLSIAISAIGFGSSK